MSGRNISEERRTLGALLRLSYEALAERVYDGLAARGFPDIRPAHSAVFRNIRPGGSRLTELAERAGMTKQSMAYLVETLAAADYVGSLPDPSDGRARLVRLTARGRRVWDALVSLSTEVEAEMAVAVGPPRMAAVRETLSDLVDRLEAERAAAKPKATLRR